MSMFAKHLPRATRLAVVPGVAALLWSAVAAAQVLPKPDVWPPLIGAATTASFEVSWQSAALPDGGIDPVAGDAGADALDAGSAGSDAGTGTVIRYALQRQEATAGVWVEVADATQTQLVTDRPAQSGVYLYRLVAITSAGQVDGTPSDPVRADYLAPELPAGHGVTRNLETGGLETTWSAPLDPGESGVAHYFWKVMVNDVANGGTEVSVPLAVFPESGTAGPGKYSFHTKAVDLAGNASGYSETPVYVIPSRLDVSALTTRVLPGEVFQLKVEPRDAAGNKVPFDAHLTLVALDQQGVPLAGVLTLEGGGDPTKVRMTPANAGGLVVSVQIQQPGVYAVRVTDALLQELSGASQLITVADPTAPIIAREANPFAALWQPYVFNPGGAVMAEAIGPVVFARCGGPENFRIDAVSGAVRWTPDTPGQVELCVSASNEIGTDEFRFTVTVEERTPTQVFALFGATPTTGPAPLPTSFDATASFTMNEWMFLTWDFGDGSPPQSGMELSAAHTFLVPGTYTVTLTATDAYGTTDTHQELIAVTDAAGNRPPIARIRAPSTWGHDSLTVDFSCDCQAGDGELVGYRWDFDQSSYATTPTASKTFGPGRFWVRLTVVDSNGLTASDELEIMVKGNGRHPPECAVSVDPPAGAVPLAVTWTGRSAPTEGDVTRREWIFADGSSAEGHQYKALYQREAWTEGLFIATDDTGLRCMVRGSAVAYSAEGVVPPQMLPTLSNQRAQCGLPFVGQTAQRIATRGSAPLRWSAPGAPAGLVVNEATGALQWTPSVSQRGSHPVVVRVENAAGAEEQTFTVDVACAERLELSTPFGCSTTGGAGALGGIAVAAWSFLSRRRRTGSTDAQA